MRHLNSSGKLGRSSGHYRSMLRNLSCSLLQTGRIKITLAKAQRLRPIVEPFITRAKKDTVAYRRLVFDRLRNRLLVTKLFDEIGPYYKERPGGYLQILKCGFRSGDKASMAFIQFVDWHTHQKALRKK